MRVGERSVSFTSRVRGPFRFSDLQKVLHDESCNSPDEGWSLASTSQFTEVWRKHCPNETVNLIKVWFIWRLWVTMQTYVVSLKGFLYLPGVPQEDGELRHNLSLFFFPFSLFFFPFGIKSACDVSISKK